MKVNYRFWFEGGGGYIFGKGSYQLLKLVEELGSIRKASEKMGMSYRHAWGIIKEIEKNLNMRIVITQRGGRNGGSTQLTDEGIKLIKEYERYNKLFKHVIAHPYIQPSLTVDMILLEEEKILLIKRKNEPFKGYYALPGGFVEYGEKVEDAAIREMQEETSLKVKIKKLVGVYSDPKRDPRGHTVTIVFEVVRMSGKLQGKDDASEAKFFSLKSLPELAFDHRKIIQDYLLLR